MLFVNSNFIKFELLTRKLKTHIMGDPYYGRPILWATHIMGDPHYGRPTLWATHIMGDPHYGRPTVVDNKSIEINKIF